MKPKRILCVWLPHWSLQRLVAAQAELKGQPLLVYELHPRGGLKIVDSSESLGLWPGMPLAEALALCEGSRGPGVGGRRSEVGGRKNRHGPPPLAPTSDFRPPTSVVPLPYDPLADRLALAELAEWCQRFSPTVGLEEAERPDCLLLDMTGLAELCGGEQVMVERVASEFHARGLTVRVALAGTIGAAWAESHFGLRIADCGMRNEEQTKSEIRNPKSEIFTLPPAALRLSAETLAWLAELGVTSIGQVAAWPRAALSSRFGPELIWRLDQATGAVSEVIQAHRIPPEFTAEWPFEAPVARREMIEFAIEQLIGRLAESLARVRQGVIQLQCCFALEGGSPVEFDVRLYQPSASARHLVDLVRLRMETLRLGQPVTAVRVEAKATGQLKFEQQALFAEERQGNSPRELALLVDRLTSRLGRQAVLRPWPLADAQPEHACQFLPVEEGGRGAGVRSQGSGARGGKSGVRKRRASSRQADVHAESRRQNHSAPLRPIWLRTRPAPVDVMAIAPEGNPMLLHWEGREYRVACCWGPERIETGWWRGRIVRRDYYRIETATGHRFWIFRQLHSGEWFLQGEFA